MSAAATTNASSPIDAQVALIASLLHIDLDQANMKSSHDPHPDQHGTASQTPVRQVIRRHLTMRSPHVPLDDSTLTAIDTLLQSELATKSLTRVSDLSRAAESELLHSVSLWRGDITTLDADAIVNAANSQMLGCFQPTHRCIDNVIHDAAGPRLRAEMFRIMVQQGHEEPTGQAKLTRAYNLPSKFVLHTVGPQLDLEVQSEPTVEQQQELENSYLNCLEEAAASKEIASVAFCCISTGIFGYPKKAATRLAVSTVLEWLRIHPNSTVKHVIFNVFLAEDEGLYRQELARWNADGSLKAAVAPTPSPPAAEGSFITPKFVQKQLAIAKQIVDSTAVTALVQNSVPEGVDSKSLTTSLTWLKSADSILLSCGAGISAAAGLDYTSIPICTALFPSMKQHGFRYFYQAIGKRDWSDELKWGYLFNHMYLARYHWPQSQIYQQLITLTERVCGAANSFIFTTNVDGMFEQNGWDKNRVYTIQGDYATLQCYNTCQPTSYWPARAAMERALPHIDPATQMLPSEYIPHCPNCGGPAFLNVRGGNWFLEELRYANERAAYHQWLQSALRRATPEKPLVLLEIGAGYNTPGVIRFPMERLAAQHPNVKLIRINQEHPEVPAQIDGKRAVGLAGSAAEIINYIHLNITK